MPRHIVQTKMRPTGRREHIRYILVMEITGAGKSLFISAVTGNQNTPIVAIVLTLGPGASAFALEPLYEKAVGPQKKAKWKLRRI